MCGVSNSTGILKMTQQGYVKTMCIQINVKIPRCGQYDDHLKIFTMEEENISEKSH